VEPSEHFGGGANPAAIEATSEDAALAAACRSGDLRAYERLYAMHGARMKNLARNVLGNANDAEDAVQETFLKVQRSIASFRGQSSFVTWTYRILINTCYDARRSRLRKKEIGSDDAEETGRRELRARSAPRAAHGARTCAGFADAAPARRFSAVRSGRIPPRGNRRDAGDYRDGLEEHAFPGEEKSSPDAGAAPIRSGRRGNTVNGHERDL